MMEGEIKPQVAIEDYKELMPVTVRNETYTIDGITLTKEQTKRIVHAYHEYEQYLYIQGIEQTN